MTMPQQVRDIAIAAKSGVPKLADFPLVTIEKLRFADTDRIGHITNSVFAVCCQNARMELLSDPHRVPLPRETQFVIAKLVLEFRAEMHWPGTVDIGTRIERVGRSSATLAQALFVEDRCVAVAGSIVALMHTRTRRAVMIPDATAEALRGFMRARSDLSPNGTIDLSDAHS
jgi:acyl-CoA thioester hydrolase